MESYISNELPYLSKTFDSVYIVPYHEFAFDETSNRLAHLPYDNLFVLKPNALPRYSPMQRVERFFDTLRILALEMVLTNQKAATFQKLKTLFFRIKHYHAIAKKLSLFVSKDNKISKTSAILLLPLLEPRRSYHWEIDAITISISTQKIHSQSALHWLISQRLAQRICRIWKAQIKIPE